MSSICGKATSSPTPRTACLLDLTPYIEADPEWKMDDFQPAAVEAASYQGKLYTIMRDFYPGPAMFFYNKDHVRRGQGRLSHL